jgi:DNA polymerase-3 subunit beta
MSDGSSILYRSRLIDGDYPAYSRVIPERKNLSGMARIDTARFRAALKRVSVALAAVEGEKKKPKEYIRLTFDQDVLRLDASGDFGESASEEIDIEWTGKAALTCGFNWRYLDAAAELSDSDEMRFWPDANGPCRIEPKHDDDRVYVVMPARV